MSHLSSTFNSLWLWREISLKFGVLNLVCRYWKNSFIQFEKLKDNYAAMVY